MTSSDFKSTYKHICICFCWLPYFLLTFSDTVQLHKPQPDRFYLPHASGHTIEPCSDTMIGFGANSVVVCFIWGERLWNCVWSYTSKATGPWNYFAVLSRVLHILLSVDGCTSFLFSALSSEMCFAVNSRAFFLILWRRLVWNRTEHRHGCSHCTPESRGSLLSLASAQFISVSFHRALCWDVPAHQMPRQGKNWCSCIQIYEETRSQTNILFFKSYDNKVKGHSFCGWPNRMKCVGVFLTTKCTNVLWPHSLALRTYKFFLTDRLLQFCCVCLNLS